MNYVTAWVACNLGKGAIPLDDHSAVLKQRAQMEDAAARREQVEMMAQWQRELATLDAVGIDVAANLWGSLVPGSALTPVGRDIMARALRRLGPELVLDAIRTAIQTYAKRGADGDWDHPSLGDALNKVAGICVNRQKQEKLPELPQLYYVRGILRNRFPDRWDNAEIMRLLQRAVRAGISVDVLQDQARDASTYWRWKNDLAEIIEHVENAPEESLPESTPESTPSSPTPLTLLVLRLCTERWGGSVNAEAIRLRIERNSFTTTRPLWILWSMRHAATFQHWCAMMDMGEAAERLEEMMQALPLPPYPPILPKDLAQETSHALVRTMRVLITTYGKSESATAHAQAVANALLYGFVEADLLASINANATVTGWWVDVDHATNLAMRFRGPHNPHPPGLEQAV